ncbi:site-specific integrase [Phaeodactylibacter sp.]|uniref:site-specific integrase n=1 Tax=Phaeodactylibacter sp. TaxID=1940289 RepID=UPI0025F21D6A|nr:site-specific integrase [Phaeodactylibacter sp.]MCI5093487.1 site-specific integrase [Phaeodactylibacter sp.]
MQLVNFYVKPPEKKNGEYQAHRLTAARPVYMYVLSEYKSQRAVHPTGLKVRHDQIVKTDSDGNAFLATDPKSHWDEIMQRVKKKAPGALATNRELDRLQRIAESVVDELKKQKQRAADEAQLIHRQPVTKEEIKAVLSERTGRQRKSELSSNDGVKLVDFMELSIQHIIDDAKARGTNGWRVKSNLLYHFKAFCKAEYVPKWTDMRLQFFEDFRDFLKGRTARLNRYSDSDRGLSDPYIAKMISAFITLLRYAQKKGYITHNHFQGIRLKEDLKLNRRKLVEGAYLTPQEIREVWSVDLSRLEPMAETVRACFVAACMHGQRHSDWHKVSRGQRVETVRGIEFVEVFTVKGQGDKIAFAPIYGYVKDVMNKTNDTMPQIPLGTVNRLLKSIGELAGIDRKINYKGELIPLYKKMTSHVARRSFVSNMRDYGTPDPLLSLVTTHGKKTMTDNYDRRSLKKRAGSLIDYLRRYEKDLQGGQAVVREIKTA